MMEFTEWIMEEHEEPIPTHIDMWYNPHLRLWELTQMDDEGNMIGETVYAYGKANALKTKDEMERELENQNWLDKLTRKRVAWTTYIGSKGDRPLYAVSFYNGEPEEDWFLDIVNKTGERYL